MVRFSAAFLPVLFAATAAQAAEPSTITLSSRIRAEVDAVLANESFAGPWSADDGLCLDLAGKWFERLTRAGIPARIVTVDPSLAPGSAEVGSGRVRAGKFHAFVIVGEGKDEVIVDASYRQFFSDPTGLPKVLVSSRAGAASVFTSRRGALRVELYDDPYAGRYEPASFTELVYGFGPNAALRTVL